jgi:hypothetical protein
MLYICVVSGRLGDEVTFWPAAAATAITAATTATAANVIHTLHTILHTYIHTPPPPSYTYIHTYIHRFVSTLLPVFFVLQSIALLGFILFVLAQQYTYTAHIHHIASLYAALCGDPKDREKREIRDNMEKGESRESWDSRDSRDSREQAQNSQNSQNPPYNYDMKPVFEVAVLLETESSITLSLVQAMHSKTITTRFSEDVIGDMRLGKGLACTHNTHCDAHTHV